MNKLICVSLIVLCITKVDSLELRAQNLSSKKLATISRSSCVKISSKGTTLGSGFFIKNDLIVTCFHVIAQIQVNQNNVNFQIYDDLVAVDENGNIASLECISIPTEKSPEPFTHDFAVLKLKTKIGGQVLKLSNQRIDVTDRIMFSGYPFGLPTLITHTGEVSGILKDSLIYVQAPVNNGNSGSALLNENGDVVGIVTFKQAGIGQALEKQLQRLTIMQQTFGKGGLQMGVIQSADGTTVRYDPIEFAKETIATLHQNLETGIGGARHIRFLTAYLKRNNIKL
jgi:S1-C subfamily serine protease